MLIVGKKKRKPKILSNKLSKMFLSLQQTNTGLLQTAVDMFGGQGNIPWEDHG